MVVVFSGMLHPCSQWMHKMCDSLILLNLQPYPFAFSVQLLYCQARRFYCNCCRMAPGAP